MLCKCSFCRAFLIYQMYDQNKTNQNYIINYYANICAKKCFLKPGEIRSKKVLTSLIIEKLFYFKITKKCILVS